MTERKDESLSHTATDGYLKTLIQDIRVNLSIQHETDRQKTLVYEDLLLRVLELLDEDSPATNSETPPKCGFDESELRKAVEQMLSAWDAQLPLGKPKVSVRFKMELALVRAALEKPSPSQAAPESPRAAEMLVKAITDALDCLENDDWRCERCDRDHEAGNSNAAYYLRDALREIRGEPRRASHLRTGNESPKSAKGDES
jgi:hypothetical protein